MNHVFAADPVVRYFGSWTSPESRFDPANAQAVCDAHIQWFKSNTENVNSVIVACEGRANNTVQTNIHRYNAANQDLGQSGFFQIAIKKHFCYETPNNVFGLSVPLVCSESEPPQPPECEPGCNGACGQQKTFNRLRTLACINQCIYRLGGGMEIQLANGQSRAFHTVQQNTGATCTPEQETVTPDPVPCPECACQDQGKSYAVMQGVAVCLEPGTPGSEPVKKQDPPKVETHTPAPTPENPNPEPVVTETPSPVITITPAPAGSPAGTAPTITETTTNADGSSTSTQQSQDAFCQANPTHKVCRQEDAKTDCDKYPDAIGCQVMGDVPEFEPLETKEIDMSSIVLRELPSDNSCPAPLTYTIGGHTITLSFDPICQYVSAFKPLVIAAAWLSAAFIIVGARKDSI